MVSFLSTVQVKESQVWSVCHFQQCRGLHWHLFDVLTLVLDSLKGLDTL